MGMFDYIKTEMPLPDNPTPPDCEWFQTKDVPTAALFMEKWIIRSDGKLMKLGVRYEDQSDPNAPKGSLESVIGIMTAIPDPSEDKVMEDFHGDLTFGHYDWKTKEWWDYTARFTE